MRSLRQQILKQFASPDGPHRKFGNCEFFPSPGESHDYNGTKQTLSFSNKREKKTIL